MNDLEVTQWPMFRNHCAVSSSRPAAISAARARPASVISYSL